MGNGTGTGGIATAAAVGCRICGSTRLSPLVRAGDRFLGNGDRRWSVGWCAACRCGTTQVTPDGEYWARAYPEKYFTHMLGVGPELDRRLQLQEVEATGAVAGARVLEIGCSAGDLLTLLRARGARVAGVESSEVSRRIARSRGLDVVATLEEVPEGAFDFVLLFDVLEHLPAPGETLRWVARRLTPAGRVVIGVPNIQSLEFRLLRGRWFALELPRHLTHFSPAAVERLAGRAGLALRSVRYPRVSYFAKSFVDPRLRDSLFPASGGLLARAGRIACWLAERVLLTLGTRPCFVAVLTP